MFAIEKLCDFLRNKASIFTYFVEYRVYQAPNGNNIWRVF